MIPAYSQSIYLKKYIYVILPEECYSWQCREEFEGLRPLCLEVSESLTQQ